MDVIDIWSHENSVSSHFLPQQSAQGTKQEA